MGTVTADMSMSLDGFITGPNDNVDNPLGEGGERLHQWVYELTSWRQRHGLTGGQDNTDADVLDEAFANTGAVVMGRGMFDVGEQPWGDEPPFRTPVYVLTHRARDVLVKDGGTSFTFVTEGAASALEQARAAAGEDKDISIAGGANVVQQLLRAGLLDQLQIHLVPVLLGSGVRFFDQLGPDQIELEPTRVISSPGVTHLRYRALT